MPQLKSKDLKRMSKTELNTKMEELRLELMKSKASAAKVGTSKAKEIKKIMARIITLERETMPKENIKLKK